MRHPNAESRDVICDAFEETFALEKRVLRIDYGMR